MKKKINKLKMLLKIMHSKGLIEKQREQLFSG